MEYLVALVAWLLAYLYFWKVWKNRNFPPGPWGLPLVGYQPFLLKKPYVKLQRLAKKYGNVFSITLGSQYVVVINDFKTTKEVYAKDVFFGRPPEFPFPQNKITEKTGSMFGPKWKVQRRLSLHMLRDLGFARSQMEGSMQEETMKLLRKFEEKMEKPFPVRYLLSTSLSNNVADLVFGRRFKYDDPVRHMLNNSVIEVSRATGQTRWTLFLPWLRKAFEVLGIGNIEKVNKLSKEGRNFAMKEIEEHEKTLDSENNRDFIDSYLLEMEKREDDPAFDKFVLQDIAMNFFGAGTETVPTVVEWLILLAAQNQERQRKMQAEIDAIVGSCRLSNWSDQQHMPFTNAFIMETLRWKTLVPMNLLRYSLADTELNGYFIPKHTILLSNLWAIHHDAEYWGEDVEEFRPERFLTEDGSTVKKFERYIPFSIGKRICPGEHFAKMELFLYFTSILQKFDIRFPNGKAGNFEDYDLGLVLRPKIQDVIMSRRI